MTHHFADDTAISELVAAFKACTLPKAAWTHAAHFAAALWLLRHEPRPPVSDRMPGLIRAFNESVGGENSDTAGYHETITQASLRAAASVLAAHPSDPLHTVLDRLMESSFGRPDWLLVYWRRDRLFSTAARKAWLEPDLARLPF